MKHRTWILLPLVLVLMPFGPGAGAQNRDAANANRERGKELFLRNYCWSCHGYDGAGASTGPRLSQSQFTVEGFTAFLRNPVSMPPFRVEVLSDSEASDLFAYILTFPPPPPLESIPLLDLN